MPCWLLNLNSLIRSGTTPNTKWNSCALFYCLLKGFEVAPAYLAIWYLLNLGESIWKSTWKYRGKHSLVQIMLASTEFLLLFPIPEQQQNQLEIKCVLVNTFSILHSHSHLYVSWFHSLLATGNRNDVLIESIETELPGIPIILIASTGCSVQHGKKVPSGIVMLN